MRNLKSKMLILLMLMLPIQILAEVTGDPKNTLGWVFVYKNNADGTKKSGNLNLLIKAVRSGADIKVSKDNMFNTCETVIIYTGSNNQEHVQCISLKTMNLTSGDISQLSLTPNPYWVYYVHMTDSQYGIASVSVKSGEKYDEYIGNKAMKWWARIR